MELRKLKAEFTRKTVPQFFTLCEELWIDRLLGRMDTANTFREGDLFGRNIIATALWFVSPVVDVSD